MAVTQQQHWFRHILAALSGTVAAQVISGIAQVAIVRTLGVSGYGQYAVLYAWLAIAAAVVGAGLDTWLLDNQSRSGAVPRAQMLRIVLIKTAIWLAAACVCWLGIPDIPRALVAWGMAALLLDTLTVSALQALRSLNRHPTVAGLALIGPVLLLCAVLSGSVQTVDTLILMQFGISLISFVCSVSALRPLLTDAPAQQPLLRPALPFVLSDILAQLYTQSGTILIGSLLTTSAVGVFRGAWSIVAYSFVFPALVFQTTLPHLNAPSGTQRRSVLGRSLLLYALYGLIMAGFAAWVAGPAIVLVYGSAYAESAAIVGDLWLIPLCKALSFAAAMILVERRALPARIAVQASVVGVLWLVTPALIQAHGIAGAIHAQVIVELVLAFGYVCVALWVVDILPEPQHPPQRIVITNMHGVGNLGDVAIHRAQYALLHRVFPFATITQLWAVPPADAPPSTHSPHGWVYDAVGTIAPLRTRVRKALILGYALLTGRWQQHWWGLTAAERSALRSIQTADMVVASGGGYLYDAPTTRPWRRFLLWNWWLLADLCLAVRWGRPVVFFPQSYGPFHSRVFAAAVRWLLQRAVLVYARDSAGMQQLRQWHISGIAVADLAWATPVAMAAHHTDSRPTLGLTVIDWAGQYPGFTAQDNYEAAIAGLAATYVARGWRVCIIIQVRAAAAAWDDTVVAQRICTNVPGVELVTGIDDPTALAQFYATLDCLVASRLHSAILRMVTGGPCVVIGYLPKAAALMADIGLSDLYLPIASVSVPTLVEYVERACTENGRFATVKAATAAEHHTLETTLAAGFSPSPDLPGRPHES